MYQEAGDNPGLFLPFWRLHDDISSYYDICRHNIGIVLKNVGIVLKNDTLFHSSVFAIFIVPALWEGNTKEKENNIWIKV